MRSAGARYRGLEDLENEAREVATPYWKAVSYLSMWLLLGGQVYTYASKQYHDLTICNRFLILPTTFDSDPQLRFSSGVIIVLVVAFLTAGYALTILLYFAVPSPLFQLESLLIPSASASFFGLCAAAWTLVSSPRFNPALPGCTITLVLTFSSVIIYGALGILTSNKIKNITNKKPYAAVNGWQDSGSTNYNPYVSSSYPLTAPSEHNSVYYAPSVHDYPHPTHEHVMAQHDYGRPATDFPVAQPQPQSQPQPQPQPQSQSQSHPQTTPTPPARAPVVEEDPVGQQMASLLAKPAPQPSPDATQQTFRLEWPADDEDTTLTINRSQSQVVSSNAKLLAPGDASKHSRVRSGSEIVKPTIRIDRAASPTDRGRGTEQTAEQRAERARSRDARRREIERDSIASL